MSARLPADCLCRSSPEFGTLPTFQAGPHKKVSGKEHFCLKVISAPDSHAQTSCSVVMEPPEGQSYDGPNSVSSQQTMWALERSRTFEEVRFVCHKCGLPDERMELTSCSVNAAHGPHYVLQPCRFNILLQRPQMMALDSHQLKAPAPPVARRSDMITQTLTCRLPVLFGVGMSARLIRQWHDKPFIALISRQV